MYVTMSNETLCITPFQNAHMSRPHEDTMLEGRQHDEAQQIPLDIRHLYTTGPLTLAPIRSTLSQPPSESSFRPEPLEPRPQTLRTAPPHQYRTGDLSLGSANPSGAERQDGAGLNDTYSARHARHSPRITGVADRRAAPPSLISTQPTSVAPTLSGSGQEKLESSAYVRKAEDGGTAYSRPSSSVCVMQTLRSYCSLTIRQQPEAARACGNGERDRRVIDPPPVLELKVDDPAMRPGRPDAPSYVVHTSLLDHRGEPLASPPRADRRSSERLIGQPMASPDEVYDNEGHLGYFFTLADLSCREVGRFKLCFRLMAINTPKQQSYASQPIIACVISNIFQVYSAKDFPGMTRGTDLTRVLKSQGVNIPAKKGRGERRYEESQQHRSASADDETKE